MTLRLWRWSDVTLSVRTAIAPVIGGSSMVEIVCWCFWIRFLRRWCFLAMGIAWQCWSLCRCGVELYERTKGPAHIYIYTYCSNRALKRCEIITCSIDSEHWCIKARTLARTLKRCNYFTHLLMFVASLRSSAEAPCVLVSTRVRNCWPYRISSENDS